jgi:hypothetical protein
LQGGVMAAMAKLISDWWWVAFFIPFGGMGEWWRERSRRRHKQRIAELKIRRDIARAEYSDRTGQVVSIPLVKGPCQHRLIKPVIGVDEQLKAWLCTACDDQLPADFAIWEGSQ